MLKRQHISYNPYFLFPFLVWVIVGGLLLTFVNHHRLFFAVNTRHNDIGDTVMYYATWMGEGQVIVTALLLLFAFRFFRTPWFLLTSVLCNAIPFAVQQWLKVIFQRPRPHIVFKDNPALHYLPDWPVLLYNSFPSGHSEGAFAFFCFLSLALPEKYRKFGFVFFILAISVCYSRMYLAAHFFEDVYTGSIIGGFFATLIYSILYNYKDRMFNKKSSISDNA